MDDPTPYSFYDHFLDWVPLLSFFAIGAMSATIGAIVARVLP